MNRQPPHLHLHSSGHWFSKWAGTFHYYGKKKREAQRAYLADLKAWAEWRADRDTRRFPPMTRRVLVVDLVERFLENRELEGGKARRSYYANHLRRFTHAFGAARGDLIKASHLQALRDDMLRGGYGPKTINHDVSAVKSLLLWASGLELIPAVNLRPVRSLPLPPVANRAMEPDEVTAMVAEAPGHIASWLAVNYLALMRPSEVVRVVQQIGEWEEPWLFRCHGKVTGRTREFRRIVFSDLALAWLDRCEPRWTREDSYYRAVERAIGPGGPHPLRHSAATNLLRVGATRADVDLLLGHLPPRVSLTYGQIPWPALRQTAGLLRL